MTSEHVSARSQAGDWPEIYCCAGRRVPKGGCIREASIRVVAWLEGEKYDLPRRVWPELEGKVSHAGGATSERPVLPVQLDNAGASVCVICNRVSAPGWVHFAVARLCPSTVALPAGARAQWTRCRWKRHTRRRCQGTAPRRRRRQSAPYRRTATGGRDVSPDLIVIVSPASVWSFEQRRLGLTDNLEFLNEL